MHITENMKSTLGTVLFAGIDNHDSGYLGMAVQLYV